MRHATRGSILPKRDGSKCLKFGHFGLQYTCLIPINSKMSYEIIRCGVHTFLREYAPFSLREGLVGECVDKLVEQGLVEIKEDNRSWLQGLDVQDTGGDSFLRRVEEIIGVLKKTQVPNATLEFFVCPTPAKDDLSHLDAGLVSDGRRNHNPLPSPSDISVVFTNKQPREEYDDDDFEKMYIVSMAALDPVPYTHIHGLANVVR